MIEHHNAFHKTGLDKIFNEFNQLSTNEVFEHQNHLGSGTDVHAVRVSVDGLQLALRIPRKDQDQPTPMSNRILALELGSGKPHLEQLHSYPETNMTVATHLINGVDFYELSQSAIVELLDDKNGGLKQIACLSDEIYESGVSLDPNPRNLLYDIDSTIQAIDYRKCSIGPEERSVNEALRDFALYNLGVFANPQTMLREGLDPDMAQGLLDRMSTVMQHRPDDMARELVMARIDYLRETNQTQLEKYTA